jgi:hypothetical protein
VGCFADLRYAGFTPWLLPKRSLDSLAVRSPVLMKINWAFQHVVQVCEKMQFLVFIGIYLQRYTLQIFVMQDLHPGFYQKEAWIPWLYAV